MAGAARYEHLTGASLSRPLTAWPRTSSFVCGAFAATALAPLHFVPALLAFACLTYLLLHAKGARQAFVLGWLFGFGHFLAGLYWIAIAFFTDVERFGALAIPAVLLLSAYLAVLPGAAASIIALRRWQRPESAALALSLS